MSGTETDHERAARERYASLTGQPAGRWHAVVYQVPEFWYDFFDPATGKYGQCRLATDGSWHQVPRGEQPVILRLRRTGRPATGRTTQALHLKMDAALTRRLKEYARSIGRPASQVVADLVRARLDSVAAGEEVAK